MKKFSLLAKKVFVEAIELYEKEGGIDKPMRNPYEERTIEGDLFRKNWIDHRQWALEDVIRDPEIKPEYALEIKRTIDKSNQDRTDLVELIDSYFWEQYHGVKVQEGATINTESPAWAIDRLSILQLKIHYMQKTIATTPSEEVKAKCEAKLKVLLEQDRDLCTAISELLDDIEAGRKYMKVYKQMKMYNDPELNPMLKGKAL